MSEASFRFLGRQSAAKSAIAHRLPSRVQAEQKTFSCCGGCGRVYLVRIALPPDAQQVAGFAGFR
jgi:hypothetical protein